MFVWLILAETPAKIDFDLARLLNRAAECRSSNGDQIIVCAAKIVRDNRVTDLGSTNEAYLPKAEVKLFGAVKGTVENEAVAVGGFPSKRMMVRVKIPF